MAFGSAAEVETKADIDQDQQGIDFVTLGMFIIGRLSSFPFGTFFYYFTFFFIVDCLFYHHLTDLSFVLNP